MFVASEGLEERLPVLLDAEPCRAVGTEIQRLIFIRHVLYVHDGLQVEVGVGELGMSAQSRIAKLLSDVSQSRSAPNRPLIRLRNTREKPLGERGAETTYTMVVSTR